MRVNTDHRTGGLRSQKVPHLHPTVLQAESECSSQKREFPSLHLNVTQKKAAACCIAIGSETWVS